ncbi:hypothetical protein GY45DRAFT_1376465, partial [Cubamyces sp. BRFM 1775]
KGFGTLYNEPRSWDFINLVSKLVPLRPIFPIEVLRRRVRSVDGAHALSPGEKLGKRKGKSAETRAPDTAGGLWVDLLGSVIEEMIFIATSGKWSEDNAVMRNYKIFLGATTSQRRSKGASARVEAYKSHLEKYLAQGEVDQAVWPTCLLESLDKVYVEHVQPAMESFMNQSTDVWAKAMASITKNRNSPPWIAGIASARQLASACELPAILGNPGADWQSTIGFWEFARADARTRAA